VRGCGGTQRAEEETMKADQERIAREEAKVARAAEVVAREIGQQAADRLLRAATTERAAGRKRA
jgi:predicted regulator of Ras-like GTPase activity (Roadblock/LC7/MglB family)